MTKKNNSWSDKHVSLRLENPKPDARTPLEGIPLEDFVKGTTVLLQDGKKLLSTGMILEVLKDGSGFRTREGIYKIFKERQK